MAEQLTLADGRTLFIHDTGAGDRLTVLWHHGTPQTGNLLHPLVEQAAARNIRPTISVDDDLAQA